MENTPKKQRKMEQVPRKKDLTPADKARWRERYKKDAEEFVVPESWTSEERYLAAMEERVQRTMENGECLSGYRVLAEKYGIEYTVLCRRMHDPEWMNKVRDRSRASIAMATAKANFAAEEAVDKTLEIMRTPITDKNIFAVQNAARDILDRTGVREKSEEENGVKVTLAGGITLGTPGGSAEI